MILRSLGVIAVIFLSPVLVSAQTTDALGTYTPYSLFGLGQLSNDNNAYHLSMGGIGIGIRDNRYINYMNPAAVSARDTLSFMMDFGLTQKNIYNRDHSGNNSAYNVFNMQNIAITVPIYKQSAFIIGIKPFSNVGYKYMSTETDDNIVANIGDVKYQRYGTGSIYQLFFGAGVTFAKYFSIGAEAIYYFGYIDRHSDILFNSSTAYNNITTGWKYNVHSFSGKFGVQYAQPFKKSGTELTIGATYRLGNKLNGDVTRYAFSYGTSSMDTVLFNKADNVNLKIADEIGVGVSFRKKDKWMVGFDFIQQNWHNSTFEDYSEKIDFAPATARYYRLGFEYIPNKYDIRYYMKRVTYRAGAYFEQSYISLNGHQVNSFGITLGATLPIFRLNNGVTVAINMGQRGTLKYNMVRERFINFMININLHDIWFVKYRYD